MTPKVHLLLRIEISLHIPLKPNSLILKSILFVKGSSSPRKANLYVY